MKLLMIGVDAMTPEIVFNNLDILPNINKLCGLGAFGAYDAYTYGYGSRDNWISIYTGLTPQQHGVVGNVIKGSNRKPTIDDFKDEKTFWKILNENGLSVGMWKGLTTTPPQNIDGYMVSGEPNFEIDGKDDPLAETMPVFCEEDRNLESYIVGEIDRPNLPKSPEYYGHSWEEIFEDNDLADEILKDDYFDECVDYLQQELNFYRTNIVNMQNRNPVDVIFYYTPIIDFIEHFQMHDVCNKINIKCLKILDDFIGNIINDLNPDNIMLFSDHGMKSLADFFPNTPTDIQREAFGWSDKSIWLSNGQIATRARNGAFLTGIHSIKGCFIASGNDIANKQIYNMRTIDIYPTLLELFDIKVPANRDGFIVDIFDKERLVNSDIELNNNIKSGKVAIIQNIDIPDFNRVINEVFLDNRFMDITIIGESKYKNILMGNPRVNNFIDIEEYKINKSVIDTYQSIFVGYKNSKTRQVTYIEIN